MAKQHLCNFLNNKMTGRNRSVLSLALSMHICAASGCIIGPGEVMETWETRSPALTVRFRGFDETTRDIIPPHYYLSFEVQDKLSHEWRRLMIWRIDQPMPIPRDHVRFVTDSIVYAFGDSKYVVTTDGGTVWSEWDAKKTLPRPEAYMIDRVLVSDDGTGSMVVRRRTNENNGRAELSTTDFGVHWMLKNDVRQKSGGSSSP